MKHCQQAHNPFVGCESSPKTLHLANSVMRDIKIGFYVSGKELGFLKKATSNGSSNNAGRCFKFIYIDIKDSKAGQPCFVGVDTDKHNNH